MDIHTYNVAKCDSVLRKFMTLGRWFLKLLTGYLAVVKYGLSVCLCILYAEDASLQLQLIFFFFLNLLVEK